MKSNQLFCSSPDSVNFLSPEICAQRIVEGVITNQKFLYIPKSYRLLEFVKRLVTSCFDLVNIDYCWYSISFLPYDAFKAILSYVLNVNVPNLKRNRSQKPFKQ